MADNTNIVAATLMNEKTVKTPQSETKDDVDSHQNEVAESHQIEVSEIPKELDLESEKPESEYESAEEEELLKQNLEMVKMDDSKAEMIQVKTAEETPVPVSNEIKVEPANNDSIECEPKPSEDTKQNNCLNLESDLPKCAETHPGEIVVPVLALSIAESVTSTENEKMSANSVEEQEISSKKDVSKDAANLNSTVDKLNDLVISEKSTDENVNNEEKIEKPLDLTTTNHVENSVSSNINVVKTENVQTNSGEKTEAELNEFLDDLQLSGELQGDLLDEEGHEGGMEQRADLEEELSDVGSNLDDLNIDKAVTIDFGKTEDDSYEDESERLPNLEKNYVADEEDYDEDDEILGEDDGEEYVEGEREQGDGEESVSPAPNKEKVLDDDEDRRNPQYIPKKGAFYEHDDRLTSDQEQAEDEKEVEAETEKQDGKKKKLWLDDGRWNHDMFNKDEQAPKSRDELLNSYGYDIRSEDCPPRARRRRRYGRGPNKYTRNWKDEDAYHKGGSESGHESEGDGRKGSFRQPNQRGRRNSRGGGGGFRGRGKMNNRRRQNSDNLSEEEQEPYDQEENSNEGIDSKNNNEPPKMLEKDFPPLISTAVEEKEIKSIDNNIINVRGTKAPFPPAPPKPSNSEKFEKSPEKPQSVRTITFENSRYTNNHRNSVESKPSPREEERVDPRNFDRGPPRVGRGRGRGREHYNAMKSKNEVYNQRPAGRGYPPDKFRNDRPFKSNNYNQRNQFDNVPPPRPKSREEVIDDIMKDLPPINIKDDAAMPHNLKSHAENRPKRYSSLRQRGAQEGNIPPPTDGNNFRQNAPPPRHSQQHFYEKQSNYKAAPSVYSDRMSAASNNTNVNHSSPVNPMITGAPIYSTYNTPYQEPFAMRASLNNAPRMYPPPPPAQPVALTPPYLTQAPQSSPALINYVPGPNHPPPPAMLPPPSALHQFPYQQYNGPQPTSSPPIVTPATAMGATVVVSQPQEVYRGGVTYYNTQSQQLLPMRMPPQRRAKAAIPIVDPTQESIAHMQMMSQGSYAGDSYGLLAEEMTTDGTLTSSNTMPVET